MAENNKTGAGRLARTHYGSRVVLALGLLVGSPPAAAETLVGAAAAVTTNSGDASHAALGLFAGWNSPMGPAVHAWYGFAPGTDAKAHSVAFEAALTTPLRGMGIALRPYLGGGIELRTEMHGHGVESASDIQAIVGAGSLWYFPKHSVLTVAAHYEFGRRAVTARVAISRRF
jgi:hypothetical protein